MPHLLVTVGSQQGLHARPASLFVQAATRQPVKVTVGRPDQPAVDARSLLSVLALGAAQGDTLQLTTDEGEHAATALEELAKVLSKDHDAS
ncbi:HPr family phosphocarrier protein [Streptomyces sp. NPDC047000]|uniref:HPr family phosphocarrier protein n=1 Tax=Streptomyces sp. NPDC047000 TaxID=3155474 RepID=UPI0033DD17A6